MWNGPYAAELNRYGVANKLGQWGHQRPRSVAAESFLPPEAGRSHGPPGIPSRLSGGYTGSYAESLLYLYRPRRVLDLMNRVVNRFRPQESASEQERIDSAEKAAQAAMNALRGMAPPMFRAATQFESMTVGEGWSVGFPTGPGGPGKLRTGVNVTHMRMERRRAGQEKPVSFNTTSVSPDVKVKVGCGPAGAAGSRQLELNASVSATYSDDPEQPPDASQAVLGRMCREGTLDDFVQEAVETAIVQINPERARKALFLTVGAQLLPERKMAEVARRAAIRGTELQNP